MYEKLEVCPSCNNSNFNNHIICTDHTVSGESFALVQCSTCSLVFTNPRPDENSIGKYYESDQYISHTNKANSFINVVYKLVRSYTLHNKTKLLKKYSATTSIFDYGCGTGDFLLACKRKGWKTIAYEPDQDARKLCKEKGLSLTENLESIDKVDVITAWHVIEHVSQLNDTIKALRKKLNKKGTLIIAVPNIESYDASYYKEHWAAYDVPRHLYHFSQQSFGKLIANNKLKLIDTLPMKFDSYYVSMLSEKYKTGKSGIIKGLKTGFKSNNEAKKSGEYSSLIYVLKK